MQMLSRKTVIQHHQTSRNGWLHRLMVMACLLLVSGCETTRSVVDALHGPGVNRTQWTTDTESHSDLKALPLPAGKIPVSVYSFRDQTGQYKPAPSSTFSTAVTQGAASLLVKALWDSQWFRPLEREGLQNILTERKIIRSGNDQGQNIPQLATANLIIEGGIVGYDSNIKTGGEGAKYFGISLSEEYRVDQVTVTLRAVDTYSGEIINAVTTTKTLYSKGVQGGVFRFIKFKRLLEVEAGYTTNEPAQLAVLDAIETAVIRLVVTGIEKRHWSTARNDQMSNPVFIAYSSAKPMAVRNPFINKLSSMIGTSIVDAKGNIIPGKYESTEFIIQIRELGDGKASITTTDKLSGASEKFTVSSVL